MTSGIIAYAICAVIFGGAMVAIVRGGSEREHKPLLNVIRDLVRKKPDGEVGAVEGAFPSERFKDGN